MTLQMPMGDARSVRQPSRDAQGRIVSLGIEAQGVLSALEGARVMAVFKNSLYLRSGDAWACLGHPIIGRGPLNITCETVGFADWGDITAVGDTSLVSSAGFLLGPLALTTADAVIWQTRLMQVRDAWRLERSLEVITDSLPADLPGEGLAFFLCGSANDDAAVPRAARQPIETLGRWLRKQRYSQGDSAVPREAVRMLLGLGPGLTPSGDDFLAGLVVGLRAAGRLEVAHALGREIVALAPLCTSEISAAHLIAALRAGLAENLQTLIHAALQGDSSATKYGLRRFDRESHYSCWDALAGVTTAFRCILGMPVATCPRSW